MFSLVRHKRLKRMRRRSRICYSDFADVCKDQIKVTGWWSHECFPVGTSFADALKKLVNDTNCAIILATEDDQITQRGEISFQARDNTILEYGMFCSHGEICTALAVVGRPKLPSDLAGVQPLTLYKGSANSFKERNRVTLRKWYESVRKNLQEKQPNNFTKFCRGFLQVLSKY